jgi:ribonuclease VapC
MVEYGKPLEEVSNPIEFLRIPPIFYTAEQARVASSVWKATRAVGMSLGDLACMALAAHYSVPAFTTEQECNKWDLGDNCHPNPRPSEEPTPLEEAGLPS